MVIRLDREICPEENKVILGSNEDLFKTDLIADDFNWIEELAEDEVVKARIRYHQAEKEATAKKNPDGTVAIHFLEPQRAITKGQAVVLYRGKHVVGGGTIKILICRFRIDEKRNTAISHLLYSHCV